MPYRITSIIETHIGGCTMKHKIKKRVRKEKVDPDDNISHEEAAHDHVTREKAVTDSNRFFHKAQNQGQGTTQTTNVNVTINPQGESCATGCFGALAQIFRKGA